MENICQAAISEPVFVYVCVVRPSASPQTQMVEAELETKNLYDNTAVTQTCWKHEGEEEEDHVSDGYVRREHLRLFRSFFLLLSPALEGDSSFSLAWLDSLEELCWLKWLGTWRASPPWEAKLALQPPTTHCGATTTTKTTRKT